MVRDEQSDHVAEEVQELVWALVDEYATDSQVGRLEKLLLENEEARRIYVMCMQMHADLHFLLSGQRSRLPATIEELMKSETAAKGKKPAKGVKGSPTSLPVADLPPTTQDVPHSNGLSH
jgi:hypothetical protein